VLCIRRTLSSGRLSGFLSGLGAATADAFYGMVAALGLTFISNLLIAQQSWLRLVGGGFLLYLGARTFFAKVGAGSVEIVGERRRSSLLTDYFSTLGLTLTNPLTILSFAAVFAGLGLGASTSPFSSAVDYFSAGLMVAGVFGGSAAWWLALSAGVGLLRDRLSGTWMRWVNKLSGGLIFVFGVMALIAW